jgi:UDP-glucose 4-epimerase
VVRVNILVTGGAGFIGSHLVDKLVQLKNKVTVLDNLTSGSKKNLSQAIGHENLQFILGDCTNPQDLKKAMIDVEVVFHLAANPEVRLELNDPETCFRQNIYATHLLLEEMRKSKVRTVVFASTSTVYGDVDVMPTSETYPTRPISLYGASKLASEALISAYTHTYNMRAIILRLANVVGPRSSHGVIHDFIIKLKKDSKTLKILGDGSQSKSYLYIDDCVDAFLTVLRKAENQVSILNVGSLDQVIVTEIAEIIVNEMGLKEVTFNYMGGVDGGRGWKGDVKLMLLDISRIKVMSWSPRHSSSQAVRRTVKALLDSNRQLPPAVRVKKRVR